MHHIKPRLISRASSTPLLRAIHNLPNGLVGSKRLIPSPNPPYAQVARRRHLHITQSLGGSPFFQLGALSNSRESQYFSKASGLSPVEHSTNLELIRSSEVEPFEGKAQQYSKNEHSREQRRRKARQQLPPKLGNGGPTITSTGAHSGMMPPIASPPSVLASRTYRPNHSQSDAEALKVGHFILRTRRLQVSHLRRLLRQSKRQASAAEARFETTSKKLKNEMRGASAAILLTIGMATGLVSWWAWPEEGIARKPRMGGWGRDMNDETTYAEGLKTTMDREWPFRLRSSTESPTTSPATMPKANAGTTILIKPPNALPSGWEKAKSVDGQTYYIDHNTRTTSWELPVSDKPKTWTVTVTSPKKTTLEDLDGNETARNKSAKEAPQTKTWSWSGSLFWSS